MILYDFDFGEGRNLECGFGRGNSEPAAGGLHAMARRREAEVL